MNEPDPPVSERIEAKLLIPSYAHRAGCLCVCCWTQNHVAGCACFWCSQRTALEKDYLDRERRWRREPVSTDEAARHVEALGLTRRELAAAVGCSLGTASRLARPGFRARRELVERVLALSWDGSRNRGKP